MSDDALTLSYERNGRGGTVTARLGDKVLAMDQVDLRKDKARKAFAEQLGKNNPAIDKAAVSAELLKLAEDKTKTRQQPTGYATEIDGAIIRPELFHTELVSGVCVPSMSLAGGKPTGKWSMLLRWHADGRREARELEQSIELSDGRRLWIFPEPGKPLPTQRAKWTIKSRNEWLEDSPAPDRVDVFRRICESIAYYLDFPESAAAGTTATLACWIMLSYVYPCWQSVPYLAVGGPLGSGKSTLFRVLGQLCFRPLESSNMTCACLFRVLHDRGGTLLLDEAERLRDSAPDSGELRSILLSGNSQGSPAMRQEKQGENFRTVEYQVYGPKCFASINRLPEALASRCIAVNMLRAEANSPKPRRRIGARAADFARLRDDLHALALDHGQTWLKMAENSDVCPETFGGRDYEKWQPLLAIASWLDEGDAGGVFDVVREFGEQAIEAGQDNYIPDADEQLLRIVAEHVRVGMTATLKAGDILNEARERDPATFGSKDKPRYSARGISAHLSRYGIKTIKGRGSTGRVYRDVCEADLRRLQRTYGFDLGFDPENVPPCTPCTDEPA